MTPVSLRQLRAIMPLLPELQAARFVSPLNEAMETFDISSPPRQAAFLAQLAHESWQLRRWVEMDHKKPVKFCRACVHMVPHPAGVQYEGRRDLGNTRPGDGERYKGRGPIQLTGRANYREAGEDLDLALEASPELAAKYEHGFQIAGWFWATRAGDLNGLAERHDLISITRAINGGLNGLQDRFACWSRAKEVLGVGTEPKG